MGMSEERLAKVAQKLKMVLEEDCHKHGIYISLWGSVTFDLWVT